MKPPLMGMLVVGGVVGLFWFAMGFIAGSLIGF